MKKWMAAATCSLLISFPLTTGAADKSALTQKPVDKPQVAAEKKAAVQKPADKPQVDAASQSNVSQETIESAKKREDARKQRDKKMKVRTKNVQSAPKTDSNALFRKSK
ncbi:MAG: hypothetical protein HZB62_14120 [Nitrospirae bacterium]|nr:hypothetical protein [Nitrospirota bacterium]